MMQQLSCSSLFPSSRHDFMSHHPTLSFFTVPKCSPCQGEGAEAPSPQEE